MTANNSFRITLRTVTPLYLGGAERQPELRTPSLRGLLRFWYRAMDPDFRKHESSIFGSGGKGGAGALSISFPDVPLKPNLYNIQTDEKESPGIKYLAYPFYMKGGDRKAVRPGSQFSVLHTIRPWADRELSDLTRKAVVAGWWAICNLGGIGNRSRRGFGSVTCVGVETDWPEASDTGVKLTPSSTKEWIDSLKNVLSKESGLFKRITSGEHSCLIQGSWILLLAQDKRKEGYNRWQQALEYIGQKYQEFRKNRKLSENAALGLPIEDRDGTKVRGVKHERSASPLIINVVCIDGHYYPVVTLLNCRVLAPDEQVHLVEKHMEKTIARPSANFVTAFHDHVKDDLLKGVEL
ncbi:MAG: type III-B CRISPR module RAMP protein Cmr1 [Candidatus Thorarchaeota archaeon]|nr:type III-B CRISPR module RAMP protein Cmr1 [Candidatus Thorarchaeota archaeon]